MNRIPWALAVLSALLQIACFPFAGPVSTLRSNLCWVCLVPLFIALLGSNHSVAPFRSARIGYLCGVLWYAGNCSWIYQTMFLYGGLPKAVSFVILVLFSLYLGLYHALFAWCVAIAARSRAGVKGALFLAPFAWVGVELARARITGFPWDLLGYTRVNDALLTLLAPVTGVMGISFVVAGVNAGIASCFLIRRTERRTWVGPCLAGTTLALIAAGSTVVGGGPPATPRQHVVMMQENLSVGAQGREVRPMSQSEELDTFNNQSLAALRLTPADLIVWPEAPSHFQSNDPIFRERVGAMARAAGIPVIAGSLGVDLDPAAIRGYFLYDSASLFDAAGSYRGRYDKIHLVPWGEYVPFKQLFAFAQKLTEGVGDMDRGHERTVFRTGNRNYGVFICYESIFGDEVRQFVRNGAEVLVNISDDGWYGDSGAPWQHLQMARMRAIENRRWLLRATNTGVTTTIDPYGRVTPAAPRHLRGAYVFPFDYATGLTLYTRFGDWFAWVCALVTAAGLLFTGWPRSKALI